MIAYANDDVERIVQQWGDQMGFNVGELIAMHFTELIAAERLDVLEARVEAGFLLIGLSADEWPEPREFALLEDGRLAWGGPPFRRP